MVGDGRKTLNGVSYFDDGSGAIPRVINDSGQTLLGEASANNFGGVMQNVAYRLPRIGFDSGDQNGVFAYPSPSNSTANTGDSSQTLEQQTVSNGGLIVKTYATEAKAIAAGGGLVGIYEPARNASFADLESLRAALNKKFGTSIIFSALSDFKGGQKLEGYVLVKKNGIVIGRSGVTVATGFDIGQLSVEEIKKYGFSDGVQNKITPYALKIKSVAVDFLKNNPLSITKSEAMEIDYLVKAKHLSSAIDKWNSMKPLSTTSFIELTPAQQTVIFSRTFHQGVSFPTKTISKEFYTNALNGNWIEAEQSLRSYDTNAAYYINRVNKEADLLFNERRQR